MSAYIVSKTHIDALLTAGLHQRWCTYGPLRWFDSEEIDDGCFQVGEPWGPDSHRWLEEHRRELTDASAGLVGAMLWAENRRSVNHRYAELSGIASDATFDMAKRVAICWFAALGSPLGSPSMHSY